MLQTLLIGFNYVSLMSRYSYSDPGAVLFSSVRMEPSDSLRLSVGESRDYLPLSIQNRNFKAAALIGNPPTHFQSRLPFFLLPRLSASIRAAHLPGRLAD